MNYCLRHGQFYWNFCIYCGVPEPPVIFTGTGNGSYPPHICKSSSTSTQCDICGKPVKVNFVA